jgi:uncharacterized protein (DUF1684 family)
MSEPVGTAGPAATSDDFIGQWEEWHRRHEAIMADRHGFLSITNIHWLDGEPQRFDDAPGAWYTDDDGVNVLLDDGEELIVEGEARTGRHNFGAIPERASRYAYWGENAVEVAKRGGYDLIRPRHPSNPLRARYSGTPSYRPEPGWAVIGRYRQLAQPRPTTVGAAVEGLEHVYHAVGEVEFSLGGSELRLTAFPGRREGEVLVLFTDATSGVTTYAANRSLVLEPAADGSVVIDFNRAVNLPCAYTDLATCPLPPRENRLPVAIEAGEKIPRERLDPDVVQVPVPPVPVRASVS